MEALRRYVSRCVYVQKSLYTLFRLTQIMLKPREDIIKVDYACCRILLFGQQLLCALNRAATCSAYMAEHLFIPYFQKQI